MIKEFCKRLKKLRIDKEWSQRDLALLLRISQANYSKYETGFIEPDLQTLIQLAALFDVTIDYLVGASNEIIKARKAPKGDISGAYDEIRATIDYGDNKVHIRNKAK